MSIDDDAPKDWAPASALAEAGVRLLTSDAPRYRVHNLGSGCRLRAADWTEGVCERFGTPGTLGIATPAPESPSGLLCADRFAAEFGSVVTTTIRQDVDDYLAWLDAGKGEEAHD